MVKRSPYEHKRPTKKTTSQTQPGDDRRAHLRSGTQRQQRRDLPSRRHFAKPVLSLEAKVQGSRHKRVKTDEKRSEGQGPGKDRVRGRKQTSKSGSLRSLNRTSLSEKKRALGLYGSLKGRHLNIEQRTALKAMIEEACNKGETLTAVCNVLEINPRAYYRWSSAKELKTLKGGGGKNKITPKEEKAVISLAKKNPHFRCRRIAYELERNAKAFIGKTKVAEILKANGLNHAFERGKCKPDIIPGEMLLHEPWRKNLLWGMDWTWVRVEDRFMYLLVLLDWYSRKIISWGLFPQITSYEVVAVVTDAVAIEKIDQLPAGSLKPRLVADHGSANISRYTRTNIEVQGLDLWLSGIGRPTGNARTERVIGTLKAEEIKLQPCYESEDEGRTRIDAAIWDYNFHRPNSGNGGFAPNSVHHMGRHELTKRRNRARTSTMRLRRNYWSQETMQKGNLS